MRKSAGGSELDSADSLASAATIKVTADGVTLDPVWLAKIKSQGKGIILLEGRATTIKPLTLEVSDSNGVPLVHVQLPMSIDGVEKMFRHVNLLYVDGLSGGRLTETKAPANYPDSLTDATSFLFVHGYNVNPEQARGWNSKMFKSMWWAGSHSRFYGFTWNGADTQIPGIGVTVNYHANVDHAFGAAQAFAGVVQTLGSNVTVAAHSLGNMLVASAIQDWGARPARFCMIDAAVAIKPLMAQ